MQSRRWNLRISASLAHCASKAACAADAAFEASASDAFIRVIPSMKFALEPLKRAATLSRFIKTSDKRFVCVCCRNDTSLTISVMLRCRRDTYRCGKEMCIQTQ